MIGSYDIEESLEKSLDKCLQEDDRVRVILADMGRTLFTDEFLNKNKEKIINVGAAEQNAISLAGGLAANGMKPYVITFASFLINRGLDQIINSVCIPNFNVKLIGIRAGLGDKGGATHTATFDLGILRSIPNIKILTPCSGAQMENMILSSSEAEGPMYIRVTKEFDRKLLLKADSDIHIGGSRQVKLGEDCTIITNGIMVSRAIMLAKMLKDKGYNVGVLDLYSIQPFDEKALIEIGKKNSKIITIEEHSTINGIGTLVSDFLFGKYNNTILKIGINNQFGKSGYHKDLHEYFGLDIESLYKKAIKYIES